MRKYALIAAIAILALALITGGFVMAKSKRGGYLGVYTQEVDREIARAFDLSVNTGAIINEIVPDSPADEAGLQEDDIILAIGGERVTDDDDLVDLVYDATPGDTVVVTVMRGDDEIEVPVEIGKRRAYRSARTSYSWAAPYHGQWNFDHNFDFDFDDEDFYIMIGNEDRAWLGVSIMELSEGLEEYFGATDGGVLVSEVVEDSPAKIAGIKAGDVIVGMDKLKVRATDDIYDVLEDLDDGEEVAIELLRDHKEVSVTAKVEASGRNTRKYYSRNRIDLPNIRKIPPIRGIHRALIDDAYFDEDLRDELEAELEDLREELRELEIELRDLRDKN